MLIRKILIFRFLMMMNNSKKNYLASVMNMNTTTFLILTGEDFRAFTLVESALTKIIKELN